jgi:phosphohistidine phosphatase
MPELLVMRHAKSDWGTGLPDFERPLSQRGHDAAPRMAQWLEDVGHGPDAVMTSAANRTLTTAYYVIEHFELADDVVEERSDLYHAGANRWLDLLWGLPGQIPQHLNSQCLLICGHNSGLDDLVEYLAGETPELTANGKLMTTAAIAVFTVENWSTLSPETARLEQIKRPRELS